MKKGQADFMIAILLIFVIGISVFLAVILLTQFYAEAEMPMYEAINMSKPAIEQSINVLDYVIPIVFVGIGIVLVVISFTVQSHPIFFIVGLFSTIGGIILSAVVSNTMEEMANQTSPYMGLALHITQGMFNYMPYIMLGVCAIALIVFYGKTFGGSNV